VSTLQVNTLAWDNSDPQMLAAHRKVMDHFDLAVSYHVKTMAHGAWIDEVMNASDADVVGFLDLDCVPLNREIVLDAAQWAFDHQSFVGTAQVSNHIPPSAHIFAAPAFFFLSHRAWTALAMPSFVSTPRADVAEELSYRAEELGLHYRALYPTHFERAPEEGKTWHLGNFGVYGTGTVFAGGIYHLYEGRYLINAGLFITRCNQIVAGTFCIDEFQSSSGDFGHRAQPDESLEIKPQRDHLSVVGHISDWLPPALYRAARSGLRLSREHFPMMHNRSHH
jgi:hypothetical protein